MTTPDHNTTGTLAPLGTGPLEPESPAAPERAVYTREDFASFLDQERAERRAWAESPESFYGVGRMFL